MDDLKMTNVELRAAWSLGVVFSLRMLGMFMVLPVLSTYGMAMQDANEALIGLAIGIYGLAQALFQIPFGFISDLIGRKPLIVSGLIIFAVGSAIAALTHSIWGLILGRALQGSSAIAAAVMALLSDLTREQNRTKAMAFIGISFGVTFAIAMVTGPIIARSVGLNGLFWSIAVLAIMGVLITILVVPTSSVHTINRESAIVRGNFSRVLSNSQLMRLNIGIFCLHAILMLNFMASPPIMAQSGFLPENQWKLYLTTMIISFSILVPSIIYAEIKRNMRRVFLSCVILIFISELILIIADKRLWIMFIGIQTFFLAFNIMEALLPSIVSKESPAGYKGTAMGIYSTSQFLGVAFGGILSGFLCQFHVNWVVFLSGALIALIWCLISISLREPPHVSSLRIALPDHVSTNDAHLVRILQEQSGVTEVVVIPEERSAYIKVDIKQTDRAVLEEIVAAYGTKS